MTTLTPIAHYHGDLTEKFGIPRQAGLAPSLIGRIVFEPVFRTEQALRGLEDFSHIWLIWGFSEHRQGEFQPMVRPPRLDGNHRMGVFATRSPFRPNGLGLSVVKLERVANVLTVSGADLLDGTPIYDIKPYLPYADSIPEAKAGFATTDPGEGRLPVLWPKDSLEIPQITELLSLDPRPAYQADPERVYGMRFGEYNVRFKVLADHVEVVEVADA